MKLNKSFTELCSPAKIYFALAILSILVGLFSGINIGAILTKLFFALIWTWILSWLCKKGFLVLSWFLVLLPFIFIVLVLFGFSSYSKNIKQISYLNPLTTQK